MGTISRTALPAARLPGRLPGRWRGGAPGFVSRLARRLALGFVNLMIVWQQRLEDRACMQAMSEAQLRDIGLTHAEMLGETAKPFWRA